MIAGIEGIHTWTPGDGGDALALGDQAAWPRYWLSRIGGLKGAGVAEDNRDNRRGRRGERPRFAVRRGKTATYEGQVQGRSLVELREGEGDLAAAFDELNAEGLMEATTPLYDADRWYMARALDYQVTDEQKHEQVWLRNFAVTLRLADPRVLWADLEGPFDTGVLAATGGATLPATLPTIIPPGASSAGVVVVANPGGTDADPIVELHGPCRHPAIWNDHPLVAAKVQLVDLELEAGEPPAIIDFRDRTVTLDGEDIAGKVDLGQSPWWHRGVKGLVRGDNPLRFQADAAAAPAKAAVSFYPADPA